MPIFTAPFSTVSLSTVAQDVYELTAPSNSRVIIRKCIIGQFSDFGDAQAELIGINIITGSTAAGSGGSAVTSRNVMSHTNAPSAGTAVARNNTTLASSGNLRYADCFNVAAGWYYDPPKEERIELAAGERGVVRISAPADGLTINGTIVYEEIGA